MIYQVMYVCVYLYVRECVCVNLCGGGGGGVRCLPVWVVGWLLLYYFPLNGFGMGQGLVKNKESPRRCTPKEETQNEPNVNINK